MGTPISYTGAAASREPKPAVREPANAALVGTHLRLPL